MTAPIINGYGYDEAVTNTGNYAGQISVSQNLLTKKIYAPQYNDLNIEKQSILNLAVISEHDLKKSITDQYLSAFSIYDQLTFLKASIEVLNNEDTILRKFVEQGIYRQTDYLAFTIALQSEKLNLKALQNQYRSELRQLNLICGSSDTTYPTLIRPEIKQQALVEKNNSAFLMKFRIDSMRLSNRKLLINNNYKPRLSWFADAGVWGSNPSFLYRNFGTSFGLNFTMPLYDGRQKDLQFQKLSISESSRIAYQVFYKTEYDIRIRQIFAELKDNEQLKTEIQKQLASSENLIKYSRQLLNKGEMSITDFVINVKNYIDIRNQLSRSELTTLLLTNELNYWNW